MEPGISIIICCYNSAARLPETIRHIALQEVDAAINWEVILVDNASTDDTALVAAGEWAAYPISADRLHILKQPLPGKNHAFKLGIEAARYDYILTCDDDNWLNPGYVQNVFHKMTADPMIGALGGNGLFKPQTPVNPEITPYAHMYVNGPQHWAEKEHWVYGAGSTYRRHILLQLYQHNWQQVTSGRTGKSLICGEDVEICFMIHFSGYKICADDSLVFRHYVPVHRQNLDYILRLTFWLSYSNVLLNSYYPLLNKDSRAIAQIMNDWFRSATRTMLKQFILFNGYRLRPWGKPAIERKINFNNIYGKWYSLLKNRKKVIKHHEQLKNLLAEPAYAISNL
jgi:glycosyltransferase involved in cell wall biosynthesis